MRKLLKTLNDVIHVFDKNEILIKSLTCLFVFVNKAFGFICDQILTQVVRGGWGLGGAFLRQQKNKTKTNQKHVLSWLHKL